MFKNKILKIESLINEATEYTYKYIEELNFHLTRLDKVYSDSDSFILKECPK